MKILITFFLILYAQQSNTAEFKKRVFEPNFVSTKAIEYGITFAPDAKELFFVRADGQWGKGGSRSTIYHSIKSMGKWSEPVIAPFSGKYNDSGPHISIDGQTLYFVSDRPASKGNGSADIWMLTRNDDGLWLNLKRLEAPINSPGKEYSPRTTANGDLYFASDRLGGFGQGDLYKAVQTNDGFGSVRNLGSIINTPTGEWNLEISDQGDVLIFEASQRQQNITAAGDLYISFKLKQDWTIPQNLVELNTEGSDLYPELIGNHTLFYSSNNVAGPVSPKIYQVEFEKILNQYRAKAKIKSVDDK